MAERSRRADATVFGFDFQLNAAIVLFLENVQEVKSLRMEGAEDIDLYLNNDKVILAQAKAVQRPREDFSHVRANLKKALTSLSEAYIQENKNVQSLVYITNSPNPFYERNSFFFGTTWQNFEDLTKYEQEIIESYLEDINIPLDKSIFKLQILPFEGSDERERYKIVAQNIRDFLTELGVIRDIPVNRIMKVWQMEIFQSGTRKERALVVPKENFIWPVIVELIATDQLPEEFFEDEDEAVYEEVLAKYKDIINNQSERFDFSNRVLNDYHRFKIKIHRQKQRILTFINENFTTYEDDISLPDFDQELRQPLIKVILYRILINRLQINRIKKGVNL